MGTYRKEWDCCGSVTETNAWEPDECPFCAPAAAPAAPIAAQLDQDAERAAFETWHCGKFKTKHSTGHPTRDMHNGIYAKNYGPEKQQLMWEVWQAARRTEPVAAQPDAELPPLPKQWHERTEKMDDASIIQALKAEVRELRQVVAPYAERIAMHERVHNIMVEQVRECAERIRLLTEELALSKKKLGLALQWDRAKAERLQDIEQEGVEACQQIWELFIAYIDGQTAGTAPELRQAAQAIIAAFDAPKCSIASVNNYVRDLERALGRTDGTAPDAAPADPMDWPLPCDVTVGNGTVRKGCKLRTLVARMESLQRMAVAALPKLTPEQQRANWDELFAAAAPSPQENTK